MTSGMAVKQMLDDAKNTGKVNDWEYSFYMENHAKPALSEKQEAILTRVQGQIDGTIEPKQFVCLQLVTMLRLIAE